MTKKMKKVLLPLVLLGALTLAGCSRNGLSNDTNNDAMMKTDETMMTGNVTGNEMMKTDDAMMTGNEMKKDTDESMMSGKDTMMKDETSDKMMSGNNVAPDDTMMK